MAKKTAKKRTVKKKAARRRNSTATTPSIDRSWEAENAADTLMRAEEIRNNPSLLKRAEARLAKKQRIVKKAMKR